MRLQIIKLGKFCCATLLVLGVMGQLLLCGSAPVVADPAHPEDGLLRASTRDRKDFVLDISGMRRHLNRLRIDERTEQIADWALYGTAMHAGLSPERLRNAFYDRVPYRLPVLEDVVQFDYGPGRRLVLSGGAVWLFYQRGDARSAATLARLADQVRMELGEVPARFSVFEYAADLQYGTLHLRRLQDIPGREMFSPRYGYHEQTVRSLAQLQNWVVSIDDVTHVRLVSGGIELGGRRLDRARTTGVTAEDIATLYQAHQAIAKNHEEVRALLERNNREVIDAFNDLVRAGNLRRLGQLSDFKDKMAALEAFSNVNILTKFAALEARVGAVSHAGDEESILERLRTQVERYVKESDKRLVQDLFYNGKMPPDAPGFSLDPQWDVSSFRDDLRLLIGQPEALTARALMVSTQSPPGRYDEAATPSRIHAARRVADVFGRDNGSFQVTVAWRDRLLASLQALDGKTGRQAEKEGITPFLELQEDLRKVLHSNSLAPILLSLSGEHGPDVLAAAQQHRDAMRLIVLMDFLTAEHRVQCARYDGPIDGTRIAMNLFYTDLLAKIWAAVDYHRETPKQQVAGFLSTPEIVPRIEPLYWNEMDRLNATRVWFGAKAEAYKWLAEDRLSVRKILGRLVTRSEANKTLAEERDLNFAHISTRVYAAGSNPLRPSQEQTPAEHSRRVMSWWDRHYSHVADYEHQYHVQNQIMKWSVITGQMVERGLLPELTGVPIDRSQRFDRWYQAQSGLRFRGDARLLPQERWARLGGTECLEILQSYPFRWGKNEGAISGGVSLGGASSLDQGSRIAAKFPLELRRGSVDYGASSAGKVKTRLGTIYDLEQPGVVRFTPDREKARQRSGPVELLIASYQTLFADRAGRHEIVVRGDPGMLIALRFTPNANGGRLNLQDAEIEADQFLLARMAALGPHRIAAEPLFQAPGRYIIDVDRRPELLLTGSGNDGAPPRGIHFTSAADAPDPSGTPGTSGASSAGAYAKAGGLDGLDLFGRMTLYQAKVIGLEEATARLRALPWQRIEHGLVVARLSTAGPGPKARQVEIETGDPRLPLIKGMVHDDMLYLHRPEGGEQAQQAFNNWSAHNALGPRDLSRIITSAQLLPPDEILHHSVDKARTTRERVAAAYFRTDDTEIDKDISASPWQRIEHDGGAAVAHFSTVGPGPRAQQVEIETGDVRLPLIKGMVHDDKLFLQRPEGGEQAQQVFNDWSFQSALAARDLSRIIMAARLLPPGEVLHHSVDKARDAGERVTAAYRRRDEAALAAALVAAAKEGHLEEALKALDRETHKGAQGRGRDGTVGEDRHVIYNQGHVAGPGPNLGTPHMGAYVPVREDDFFSRLAFLPEQEARNLQNQTIDQASGDESPSGSTQPGDEGRGQGGGTRRSHRSITQQITGLGQLTPDRGRCPDLNADGELDEFEQQMCQFCQSTDGDLNGDGIVDAGEADTCRKK